MTEDEARALVLDHFQQFVAHNNLRGVLRVDVRKVQATTAQAQFPRFARTFTRHMVHSLTTDDGHFGGVQRVRGQAGRRDFENTVLMPLLSRAEYFLTLTATIAGKPYRTHAIVLPNATVGNLDTIIDPITGTYQVLTEARLTRERSDPCDKVHYGFQNGFGTHCADYDANVCCVCEGSHVLTCRARASGTDSRPMMSAKAEYEPAPPRQTGGRCCEIDYVFVGAGGFPATKITYKSKSHTFSVETGAFSWTYLNEQGTLAACCPKILSVKLSDESSPSPPKSVSPPPVPPAPVPPPGAGADKPSSSPPGSESQKPRPTASTLADDEDNCVIKQQINLVAKGPADGLVEASWKVSIDGEVLRHDTEEIVLDGDGRGQSEFDVYVFIQDGCDGDFVYSVSVDYVVLDADDEEIDEGTADAEYYVADCEGEVDLEFHADMENSTVDGYAKLEFECVDD